jgi:hypothetical protein
MRALDQRVRGGEEMVINQTFNELPGVGEELFAIFLSS